MDLTTLCVLILVSFVKNHTKGEGPLMAAFGALGIEPRNPTGRCPQSPWFENLLKVRYESQACPAIRITAGRIM